MARNLKFEIYLIIMSDLRRPDPDRPGFWWWEVRETRICDL